MTEEREPAGTTHSYADMIRARLFAIACGYEDCDDLDVLRFDPAFKLAYGRLSETGDAAHGGQQLALFNARYDG
jgi:hypothetical protein